MYKIFEKANIAHINKIENGIMQNNDRHKVSKRIR
jgi:hypothetical protein